MHRRATLRLIGPPLFCLSISRPSTWTTSRGWSLPGLAARLSLVLAYLDWAAEGAEMPCAITVQHFGRAAHLVEAYILPMARRADADASVPVAERAARRLVAIIRDQAWQRFTSRDILRLEMSGLRSAADLNPALAALKKPTASALLKPRPARKGAGQRAGFQ